MRIIGHGIDLIEIARIARMIEDHSDHFTSRCFTAREQRYADEGGKLRAERYAGRFAAKEAVLKALGTGWTRGIGWDEIEIMPDDAGRPRVSLNGRCAEIAAELGVREWHASISHDQSHVIASVLAIGSA